MDIVKACSKALVVAKPKGTIGPSKKKVQVLNEDEYTEGVEKILERDFFPDLSKMKAQAEYYEALDKNDLVKLRQLQNKFSKRPDTGFSVASSPATFETPEHPRDRDTGHKDTGQSDKHTDKAEKEKKEPKQHLDAFLSKNTSEDNASFVEILEENEKKHREKHAWLFENEDCRTEEEKERLCLPSIEEQAAITDGKAGVDTWKYRTRNAVMYVPDGEDYSAEELMELNKKKPRKIVYDNTRFQTKPWDNQKNKESLQQAAFDKANLHSGKIGHDGKELQSSVTPRVNGYGFVATPSPAPGVNESPLMTWGEIEGTPFQLEPNETPLVPSSGPTFKIPDVPKRDRIAFELAEKASKQHRDKKETALRLASRLASPTPKFGMSHSDRINSMSPAAQRLIGKSFGVRTHTDKALRASYSPSPGHGSVGDKTPTLTPKGIQKNKTPSKQTPGSKRSVEGTPSLTDNLLQIPRKRQKAADFFSP